MSRGQKGLPGKGQTKGSQQAGTYDGKAAGQKSGQRGKPCVFFEKPGEEHITGQSRQGHDNRVDPEDGYSTILKEDRLQEQGFSLVSGGTDNHLVLADLRESHPDTTGKDAEEALEEVGIVLNANTVPGETRSPFNPSGIRVGTPALTTRGFNEEAIREVADLITRVVDAPNDDATKTAVSERVDELTDEFPLY